MKKIFRLFTGYFVALPIYLLVKIHSLFVGKERAIEFWGPAVSYIVKKMATIALIPKIKEPSDFNLFAEKMKKNIRLLKPLYDTNIAYHDNNTLIVHYHNCPHCEAFKNISLPEMGPFACQSDWDIAADNASLWEFQRNTQIGTGDDFCDHTYKRFKNI